MSEIILGIDPGLDGAFAYYTRDTGELEIYDTPTLQAAKGRSLDITQIARWLEVTAGDVEHVFIERVHAMPKQGVASSFNFGKSYGEIRGLIVAHSLPITMVTPQAWKKAIGVPKAKDGARARASELLPAHAEQWHLKRHHGRAEAALLALYGARQMAGKEAA